VGPQAPPPSDRRLHHAAASRRPFGAISRIRPAASVLDRGRREQRERVTQVQMWTCNGTGAQQWTVATTDNSIKAWAKGLDVAAAVPPNAER